MTYTVEFDKAISILECLKPTVLVVKGISIDSLTSKLDGYDIVRDKNTLKRRLSKITKIIILDIDFDIVDDICDELGYEYAIVYLFPKSIKEYASNLLKSGSTIDTVKKKISDMQTEYKKLLADRDIFTILINE